MNQEFKQVQMMEIVKIKPHPSNETIYLTADVSDLVKSMKGIGEMLEPIILTKSYFIISGHRRYNAAIKLGWKSVPVRIIDIPEEHQLIYLIAANSYREKTWGEKAAEITAIQEYAKKHGKDGLLQFLDKKEAKLTVRQQIAEVVGLCEVYVSRLQKILDVNPKYITLIDNGDLTFNKAYKECVKGKAPVPQLKTAKIKDVENKFYCADCPNNKNKSTND